MNKTVTEKVKESKTFCILPFIHLYVHPDGKIAPCCIGNPFSNGPNMKNSTIEELINSKELKEVRESIANELEHPACSVCFNSEKLNGDSSRFRYNKHEAYSLPEVQDDYSVPTSIQHLDIRFSNLCNLKCRMCNPEYSSMWYEDWHKLHKGKLQGTKVVKADENAVEKIKPYIANLKTIYFAGGEPLLMKEHMDTLTYLHETFPNVDLPCNHGIGKNLQFHYNTNLHVLKYNGEGFIDKWKDFRKVNLSISCDGIGPVGEFQRTGFKTERFLTNLNTLVNKGFKPLSYRSANGDPNCRLLYNFQYTVTPLNVFHIFEFIDFLLDNKYIYNDYDVDFRYAWSPLSHTVKNMPIEYKIPAITFLESCKSRNMSDITATRLDGLIKYIKEEPEATPEEFHRDNSKMDNVTSINTNYTYLDFISNKYNYDKNAYLKLVKPNVTLS